jgi:hypothetical protein
MTHEYSDDECDQCMAYTQIRKDSDKWECSVCKLVEDTIYLSPHQPIVWYRYELSCGHQSHFRCFRTWCKQNGIACVVCGPIDEFCEECNHFSHLK